ncbi:hypothetical protein A2768_00015 [Candidatus Roizmanbacteria bacterium RIFCSPHIGHO2_01_FULL_37_16]|nr:MAG: hypothetical protein A2768_00015 [Candidatus Roizmanbacteria bacterium RIFCSPHIGHO2_01_FULL_37_16]
METFLIGRIQLILYRFCLGFIVTIQTLFFSKKTKDFRMNVTIFTTINKPNVFLSLISMASLNYFIPGIRFTVIDGGGLNRLHYLLFKLSKLNISFIEPNKDLKIKRMLNKYSYLLMYYKYGWSGKKFIHSLFQNKKGKIIILDLDTLFYKEPNEIINWILSSKESNLYLEDYENFSVISTIEAKKILNADLKKQRLNSGFICISLDNFWHNNSASSLNFYIKKIIEIVNTRLKTDYLEKNPLDYLYPIIEQTLFWLALNKCNTKILSQKYLIYPKHLFKKAKLEDIKFIHFTGDIEKLPMYKYLLGSLKDNLLDKINGRQKNDQPWYIYSGEYCRGCRHGITD